MDENTMEEQMVAHMGMPRITHDFKRTDLNEMRDRVNDLIDKDNAR